MCYNDYGKTNNITQGFGYNEEQLDSSGLMYLRARYYDPSISRFVQIDNNYAGEQEQVNTQNRYSYTLNNPYKYVDRDGNRHERSRARNNNAGLKHIVNGHATNSADKGITNITGFLYQTLQSTTFKTGMGAVGPYEDYIINGNEYRVAFGTNGFIVSFYPIK